MLNTYFLFFNSYIFILIKIIPMYVPLKYTYIIFQDLPTTKNISIFLVNFNKYLQISIHRTHLMISFFS